VTNGAYVFGDTDLAARRLEMVCDLFEEPSRTFITAAAPVAPRVALDLGCGIGRTTRLVAEVTGAVRTIGLDRSDAYVDRARAAAAPAVEFLTHDVTDVPFPAAPADLIYARLLLAHLPAPAERLRAWASQVAPGGRLLVDENEYIDAADPVLARYEAMVTELIAASGASIHAGPEIAEIDLGAGWQRVFARVERWAIAEADAARMFAMNFATWRHDAYVRAHSTATDVDDLAAGLDSVAASGSRAPVWWGIRQLAYERSA
jgi:trans-aconitate 2-methyltransferase